MRTLFQRCTRYSTSCTTHFFLSKIDLKTGFHQIRLSPTSINQENIIPDTGGSLRIPRNALWFVVDLSIYHERGVQNPIKEIGVGLLR